MKVGAGSTAIIAVLPAPTFDLDSGLLAGDLFQLLGADQLTVQRRILG
jgi:hypothetical protein